MSDASTVLIVDDEPTIRDTIQRMLSRMGYALAFGEDIVKRSRLKDLVLAIRKVAQPEHAQPPAGPHQAEAGRGSR